MQLSGNESENIGRSLEDIILGAPKDLLNNWTILGNRKKAKGRL